jgi:exopolyphosphatase/guanosine-5'-triphosphate,3'-diphosphate pyrophosphatase
LAYVLSAAMPGILPAIKTEREDKTLILKLPKKLAALNGERLQKRANQFAKLFNCEIEIKSE